MNSDWFDTAKEEFMIDLALFNSVSQEDAQKIYSYLVNVGLIDYDVEKEFLFDQYTELEEEDDEE